MKQNYRMRLRALGGPLRLLWGGACAALGLLALLPAPTAKLWEAAVGVTEFGHYLAALALLPWLPGRRRTAAGRLGALLGAVSAALSLTPLVRALPLARRLPARLDAAFGPARLRPRAPLSLRSAFLGVAVRKAAPRTLVYRTVDGQPLTLDLYAAGGQAPAPLVVVVHGGSWQSGDATQLAALNGYLADRGYAVAAISYRLAPRWIFPAAADDLAAAIDFLKRQAGELGIDAARIALIGRSAGGQLALLQAYTAHDPAIRAAIAFYAPFDMRYGYDHPANPRVLDTRGVLEAYLGGTPQTALATYEAASPIAFVGAQTPPTLLIHGPRDELVTYRQSQLLAERLRVAGVPHLLLTLPWATHGCDYNFSGPSGQLTTYAVEQLLDAQLRRA